MTRLLGVASLRLRLLRMPRLRLRLWRLRLLRVPRLRLRRWLLRIPRLRLLLRLWRLLLLRLRLLLQLLGNAARTRWEWTWRRTVRVIWIHDRARVHLPLRVVKRHRERGSCAPGPKGAAAEPRRAAPQVPPPHRLPRTTELWRSLTASSGTNLAAAVRRVGEKAQQWR
jgi:hypothetical protein